MAHFNLASHTASGALATGGIRHNLREISVPPAQNESNAKQRRLSRPNSVEELRRKRCRRNKKEREKKRKLTREENRKRLMSRTKKKLDNDVAIQESKYNKQVVKANKERKRAVNFWNKWREERMLRTTSKLYVYILFIIQPSYIFKSKLTNVSLGSVL